MTTLSFSRPRDDWDYTNEEDEPGNLANMMFIPPWDEEYDPSGDDDDDLSSSGSDEDSDGDGDHDDLQGGYYPWHDLADSSDDAGAGDD